MLVTPRSAVFVLDDMRNIANPSTQIAHIRNIFYIARMARPEAYPVKKLVGLTAELAEKISEFRFDERIKSENEAIRRLIEVGLEAIKKKKR